MTPETCPNCGAEVPRGAKVCPECGSDEETGWSEGANEGSLDLPSEEFDYDKFVKEEFGKPAAKPHGIAWLWWVVAILVLAAFLIAWLR